MDTLPEATINLIVSLGMGILGGLLTIPIQALVSVLIKRDEIKYQHRLDIIEKKRELFLSHQLEMKRQGNKQEISDLREYITRLEAQIEKVVTNV